jgi:hypothetical protein
MKYDQYQQLYNAAKEQIAARVDKIQPRAGNGASINGMGIAIEVPAAEEPQPENEDWLLYLFASVDDNDIEDAGFVSRGGDNSFFVQTAFWGRTSVFDIPAGPIGSGVPRQYEAKRIRFWARAIEGSKAQAIPLEPVGSYGRRLFNASYYRIPVRLTVEQVNLTETSRPNQERLVAEYKLDLRRHGQEQLFRPIGSDVFQSLAFKSLELL